MELLTIFLIGFVASFIGSFMSGTAALIAFTGLYALGLPSYVVLGVFRVGGFGFSIGGAFQYFKAKQIDWSLFLPITTFGLIGSVSGALLIVNLSEGLIERVVGLAMLLFIPILLLNPKLGLIRANVSKTRRRIGHLVTFLTTFWGASFTVGVGYLSVMRSMYLYGLTLIEAKAVGKLPGLAGSIAVLLIFSYEGIINWTYGLTLFLGMFLGSYIGTHYVIKIGNGWLRYLLLITIGLFSMKLILGY